MRRLGGAFLLACGLLAQAPANRPFSVTTLAGETQPISWPVSRPLVLIFFSTQCPISNAYNSRLNSLYREYSAKGVPFVVLDANRTETAAEIAAHRRAHQLEFPIYRDEKAVLAGRFGASVTPEAFVFGPDGAVLYRGAIDDAVNEARVRLRGLQLALDAVLAGQPVAKSELKAFGCTIKRGRPQP